MIIIDVNKDQSNLAESGIAVASTPNSSFVFARWQHRTGGLAAICNLHVLAGDSTPKSSLHWGLTQCGNGPHNCTCQMTSKSVERITPINLLQTHIYHGRQALPETESLWVSICRCQNTSIFIEICVVVFVIHTVQYST